MAFQRPTLGQLVDRIQGDFVSKLELVGALLRRAMVYVLSRVIAGAAHMLHGNLEYLGRQLFPDLSDDTYLIRQAAVFGLKKDAADFAEGTATATGTNGSPIPAGSSLTSSGGFEYTTDADATIAAGVATVSVTAVLAGAASTLIVGSTLSFGSPVAGVGSSVAVASSTQDGSDEETTDSLRTRLIARMGEPPEGGNLADYVEWAKEVAGVTRVWPVRLELGPGTVVVRFVRDLDAGSPIPDSGEVAAVQVHLGGTSPLFLDGLAPAHATVTVIAPVDAPLALALHISPDTTVNRAAVAASFADMLFRDAVPGGTILLSHIRDAIGEAVDDYTLSSPSADVTHTTGQLASAGTITWS